MLKHTILTFCAITAFTCSTASAQHAKGPKTKYFLNELEIAPQSIQFLNVRHIDSIRTVLNKTTPPDTTIILYSSKQDSLVSFDKVMDDYFVEPAIRHFKINTPNYLAVEEAGEIDFLSRWCKQPDCL